MINTNKTVPSSRAWTLWCARLVATALVFGYSPSAFALAKTNTGAWATTGSWQPSGTPVSTDWVYRVAVGSAALNGDFTVDSLTVRIAGGGAYQLNADSASPYVSGSVTLNQTGLGDVTNAISVLGAGVTFRVGDTAGNRGRASIVLGGANSDFSFLVDAGNTLHFSDGSGSSEGRIEGAGKNLALNGTGTYTFDTANTFGGVGNTITLNGGIFNINHASALGNANNRFILNGGTIDNNSTGAVTVAGNAQTWNNNFTFTGTRNLDLGSGNVTLGNHITVNTAQSNLTVGGSINDGNNGYNLVKTGAGNLILNGQVTNTGRTEIRSGTLTLGSAATLTSPQIVISNGATLNVNALSGGLILASGQTLSGHGTVEGNTTVGDGATLSPGSSYGIFTMSNLTLAAGSKVDLEIGGNTGPGVDYDQVVSTGSLTYEDGAILRVTFQNAVDNPLSLTLKVMDFASYLGAVGPQIELVGQADDISYNKDTGELTFLNASVVPEPGTLALMLGAGTLLLWQRRRIARK